VPPNLPATLPGFLAAFTDSVICDAAREFPDRNQCAEFCGRVISKLTPRFSAAVSDGSLLAQSVRRIVSDLLRTLVVYNSDYDLCGYRLQQEFWQSDEWLALAAEIGHASGGKVQLDEKILTAVGYVAEPMLRQFKRDLWEKYGRRTDEGPPGFSTSPPVYAKPLWVGQLRVELAKEHLSGVFRIYGEALKKTRNPRTPSILRAILARFLLPLIEDYIQSVKEILGLAVFRNRYISEEALAMCEERIDGYIQGVSCLAGIWTDAIEIEARGLEFSPERTVQPHVENVSSGADARKLKGKGLAPPALTVPSGEESRSADAAKEVAPELADHRGAAGGAGRVPPSSRSGETGQSGVANTRDADVGRVKCKHTPEVYNRVRVIEQNPGLSAKRYCDLFESNSLPLPEKWQRELEELKEPPERCMWGKLYRSTKYRTFRKRIDTMFHKYKLELRD
jgi:hypothetical protein